MNASKHTTTTVHGKVRSLIFSPDVVTYLLKPITGMITSFPMGFIYIEGHICMIHNPQTNITYCLCLAFHHLQQKVFEDYILSCLIELERPFSLVLGIFDIAVEYLRVESCQSHERILRTATALSTGSYTSQNFDQPLDSDLNKISRSLTAEGDRCAAQRRVVKRIIKMLEDLRDIVKANKEASKPTKVLELQSSKWFYGEDILEFLIPVAKTVNDDLDEHAEKIQAHVQTVCHSQIMRTRTKKCTQVYSFVAQQDSQANIHLARLARRDTKLNTLIATLARRDSTDMRVITWITLFFLPATFTAVGFLAP